MADIKTPLHKIEHPAYGWIALILSLTVIMGVAGWYYLVYSQGLNDDLVRSVKEITVPRKDSSVSSASTTVDITAETSGIDQEINAISESDLGDAQLDNTILGIQ